MSRRADEPGWLEAKLGPLCAMARQLGAPPRRAVSLDDVAEALGADWVTPLDIERVFDALAERGIDVVELEPIELGPSLRQVLTTARALRAEGRPASPSAIAAAAGLEEREVRVALLYAEVLSRGRRVR